MAEDNNVTSSKICRPCRPELWQTEDSTETQKNRELCRKATKIPLCSDGAFLVDWFYCDIWGCERCGPRLRKQILDLIQPYCSSWYRVLEMVNEDDLVDMEMMLERTGTPWVAIKIWREAWMFLTEKQVIEESSADPELTLSFGADLQWPSMSRERRFLYSKGLFPEYTKIVEAKDYIEVKENPDWVREILRRQGYIDSWQSKMTLDPYCLLACGDEVKANMIEDILNNKWFTVLKREGV